MERRNRSIKYFEYVETLFKRKREKEIEGVRNKTARFQKVCNKTVLEIIIKFRARCKNMIGTFFRGKPPNQMKVRISYNRGA